MIEIINLYKSYGNKIIYEGLNLKFEEQEITSLLGPSGVGKTTLLRLLAGLEPYDSGKIIGCEGKRIACVFQEDRLMPWLNAKENMSYVLKSYYTEDYINQKIDGIFTMLELEGCKHQTIDKLSGGMQRRIVLGRALAYTSDILLMDEPFKGLDEALKQRLYIRMKDYLKKEQRTVICVTHDIKEANQLGKMIFLKKGS